LSLLAAAPANRRHHPGGAAGPQCPKAQRPRDAGAV